MLSSGKRATSKVVQLLIRRHTRLLTLEAQAKCQKNRHEYERLIRGRIGAILALPTGLSSLEWLDIIERQKLLCDLESCAQLARDVLKANDLRRMACLMSLLEPSGEDYLGSIIIRLRRDLERNG